MNVLALDPGTTVGIALVEPNGKALFTASYFVGQIADLLRAVHDLYGEATIVVESPPHRADDKAAWYAVERAIKESYDQPIHFITPGLWKPLTHVLLPEKERKSYTTQHEKDALCLARHYLRRHDGDIQHARHRRAKAPREVPALHPSDDGHL